MIPNLTASPSLSNAQVLERSSLYQMFIRNATPEGSFHAAIPLLSDVAQMGFDYVYLTPVHPIGRIARKGSAGSPYAILDYRAVDPELGGEAGFRAFIDAAHALGLGVIMDVVYNHTSPDSILATEHPEWFHHDASGKPHPRVAEWSDVVDMDYRHPELREYLIQSLEGWAGFGVDGFRCDVASLVPVDFWIESRRRVSAIRSVLWLAESVHSSFVTILRRSGVAVACDPDLHRAFDLSYDYDGRSPLEEAWAGSTPLSTYLRHVALQESLYPESARKLRFLENHDQERAAARFGTGTRLRSWTLFAMLLPGTFMAYMGQELALTHKPTLFEPDPLDRISGDPAFREFFARAHGICRRIREAWPVCDLYPLAEGVVLLTRSARGAMPTGSPASEAPAPWYVILNLDGRSGRVPLPFPIAGCDALSGSHFPAAGSLELGPEPLVLGPARF